MNQRADPDVIERPPPADPSFPASTQPAIPALQYDTRPPGITRRQMSYFLLLLTINTMLFAGFICLPTVSPMVKDWWADYQKRREQNKQAAAKSAKLQAALADCLAYSVPPDTLIYAEGADDAAKMLTADGRARSLPSEPPLVSPEGGRYSGNATRQLLVNTVWQPPVRRPRADALVNWLAAVSDSMRGAVPAETATVFLGEMKTPGGQRRLVCVSLAVDQKIIQFEGREGPHRAYRYELETRRMLSASVFNPQKPGLPVQTAMVVYQTPEQRTPIPPAPADPSSAPGRTIRPGQPWRIFAGQIDPADPSHLTIKYEIDGRAGVIDGRLNDGDRLMLTPRVGGLVSWTSASEYLWDMGIAPTTSPSRPAATTRDAVAPPGSPRR
jgi:hypothetical protein